MNSHSFSDLGLSESILQAVRAQGYTTPTAIQSQAIPILLSGENLLGTAQTGTGKTAAFTLPLLQHLIDASQANGPRNSDSGAPAQQRSGVEHSGGDAAGRNARRSSSRNDRSYAVARPLALILAPTRELAIQINESLREYRGKSRIGHTAIFGGAPKGRQLQELRRGPTAIVATPGRLMDFIGDGAIDLRNVQYLIIDEADRMLDMGFIPTVREIAEMSRHRKQTALFSATMPNEVSHLATELLGSNAQRVAIAPKAVTADGVKQTVLHMRREDKIKVLPMLIQDRNMFRVLVFTRTKHRAARVAKVLSKAGIPSDEIHGNRSQSQRQRALEQFRRGKIQVLVGTDVAARGIDVDDITHVINYEIPMEPETYVHRIGRTARAGSSGEALNFCDTDELNDFRRIERLLKGAITVDRDHDTHVEPPIAAATRGRGGNGSGGRAGNGAGGNGGRRGGSGGGGNRGRRADSGARRNGEGRSSGRAGGSGNRNEGSGGVRGDNQPGRGNRRSSQDNRNPGNTERRGGQPR